MPSILSQPNRSLRTPIVASGAFLSRNSRQVGSRLARWGTLLLCSLVLGACAGGGGSGGGGTTTGGVVAVDPVLLAPGQTAATLAWDASEGPVENYLVFESRNSGTFEFSTMALTPEVEITGTAGDRVRITVVAVSPNGAFSENSPPSPPIVFQAANTASVARIAPIPTAPLAAPSSEALAAQDAAANEAEAQTEPDAERLAETDADADADADATDSTRASRLVDAVREALIAGDARLPEAGLSAAAHAWLQDQVDFEVAAGVALAGTGRGDDDELREMIWRDAAGQLFVSTGEAVLAADDLPGTLDEALRLHATERFVGLDDFDGDAVGDWLVEDTATGQVYLVSGTDEIAAAPTDAPQATLAGHGDFDGDGVAELLWRDEDRALQLVGFAETAPRQTGAAQLPEQFELLAIADLDGNGRDDLLGRSPEGSFVYGLSIAADDSAPIEFRWQTGAAAPADLDLVATLDIDEDGAAEIAWLADDALEIWTATDGLENRFAL